MIYTFFPTYVATSVPPSILPSLFFILIPDSPLIALPYGREISKLIFTYLRHYLVSFLTAAVEFDAINDSYLLKGNAYHGLMAKIHNFSDEVTFLLV